MENEERALVMFCTKCGKKFDENAVFCMECGTKRESTATPIPQQPAFNAPPTATEAPTTETPATETPVAETPVAPVEYATPQPVATNNAQTAKTSTAKIIIAVVILFVGIYIGLKPPFPFLEIGSTKIDESDPDATKDPNSASKSLVEDSADDYDYEITNGKVEIVGYIGDNTKIVIPSKIEGSPVTSIGVGAFDGCQDLSEVIIPTTVTEICDSAFSDTALLKITIPTSVDYIDDYAFSYCGSLKAVYFEGDMPEFVEASTVFEEAAKGFTIYYKEGKQGWADFDDFPTKTY